MRVREIRPIIPTGMVQYLLTLILGKKIHACTFRIWVKEDLSGLKHNGRNRMMIPSISRRSVVLHQLMIEIYDRSL